METGNWKLETGNWKLKTENWKLETGNWKLETANWKLETGNWKLETGIHMKNPSEGSQTKEEKRSNTKYRYEQMLVRIALG